MTQYTTSNWFKMYHSPGPLSKHQASVQMIRWSIFHSMETKNQNTLSSLIGKINAISKSSSINRRFCKTSNFWCSRCKERNLSKGQVPCSRMICRICTHWTSLKSLPAVRNQLIMTPWSCNVTSVVVSLWVIVCLWLRLQMRGRFICLATSRLLGLTNSRRN